MDGNERFGKGLGREGFCVVAVTGGRREDIVGRGEGFSVARPERFLQLIEGAAAILEDQAKVAQHVGIKRDGAGEQEGDAPARTETVAEEIGAAFVADASCIFGQLLVGLYQTVAKISDRDGYDREYSRHAARGTGAGIGDILKRDVLRVFKEMDDPLDLLSQPGVIGRTEEAQFTIERIIEVTAAGHVSSGYSSRMAAAQVPVKSMAETQARRGFFLLPRSHGRASESR